MASPAITSIFQEIQNFNQDRRADVRGLGNALQSGNLDAAKQAFNDLAALGKSGPYGNSEPFARTARAQAFEAIGQALQAGDLAGAQTAFAKLVGHQGSAGAGQGSPAVIVNISGTQNSGTAGNVADTESIYQQLQQFRDTRKADITQLGTELQSGDVNGAQKAYGALVALGKNGPNGNNEPFQQADRVQAFDAIGKALKAGDLAGAQQAFADLAATYGERLQPPKEPPVYPAPVPGPVPEVPIVPINLVGGGPAPTPSPTQPAVPAPTPTPTPVPPTGFVPEVVINLGGASGQGTGVTPEVVVNIASGNSSSSPESVQINFGNNASGGQLTIDVSQLQGTKTGEQVKIDFNQGGSKSELIVNLFNPGSSSSTSSPSSLNLQA
jgi:hypothetical protein